MQGAAKQTAVARDCASVDGRPLPLVVTEAALFRCNLDDEVQLALLRQAPRRILERVFATPTLGRAALEPAPEIATLPVHANFIEFAEQEAAAGGAIILATSAAEDVVQRILERFSFISGTVSLDDKAATAKGRLRFLERQFPQGFRLAGRHAADLAIWRTGVGGGVVNADGPIPAEARSLQVAPTVLQARTSWPDIVRRTIRLHHWAKNALIFVPLILGGRAAEPAAWWSAAIGFIAIGLVASGTYILDDLWDLPNDRRHRSKFKRPLASGALSVRRGAQLAVICIIGGFLLALSAGLSAVAILSAYFVLSLSYTFVLKRLAIVDVVVLAGLFTLRLHFGTALASVAISPWLLVFSMFAFLSLSIAKRHAELVRHAQTEPDTQAANGRGYRTGDMPFTLGLGLAAQLGAVLIMVLFLIEDAFARGIYASPGFLWPIPLLMFLFLARIWLLAQRGELYDDPLSFAMTDRASLLLGAGMVVSLALALVGLGR